MSVYVKSLYVRNFRNFSECEIPLRSPITAIIGPNSIGKSNIIAALRLLLDAQLSRQSRLLDEEDFYDPNSIRQGREIIISAVFVGFEANSRDTAFCAKWKIGNDAACVTYRFRPNDLARIDAREREEQRATAQKLKQEQSNDDIDIPPPWEFRIENYDYDRLGGLNSTTGGLIDIKKVAIFDEFGVDCDRALNQFAFVEMPAIRDVVRDLAARRTSPLHRLIDQIKVPAEVRARVEEIVRTPNDAISNDPFFKTIEKDIDDKYEGLAAAPEPLSVKVGIADPKFNVAIRSLALLLTDAALSDAELNRNGLGYNNLLYIAILLQYFDQRTVELGSYQMLVIEEPEAHLHPNAQAALVESLSARGHQTIVTSHSGTVLAAAKLGNVVAVNRGKDGAVALNLLESIGANAAERADLDRYLDLNRSGLLLSREIVLVEGISEELLISALAQRRKVELRKSNISIIGVVGTHFGLLSRFISSAGLNIKCHVVSDGDQQNSKAWIKCKLPDTGARIGPRSVDAAAMYKCATTLEIAITQPANRSWIVNSLREVGAPRVADGVDRDLQAATELQRAQLSVVRTARRIGKGRFAQALVTHIDRCGVVPEYLDDLLNALQK